MRERNRDNRVHTKSKLHLRNLETGKGRTLTIKHILLEGFNTLFDKSENLTRVHNLVPEYN